MFPLGNATPPNITVGSAIIGATVTMRDIQNLTESITFDLALTNEVHHKICGAYIKDIVYWYIKSKSSDTSLCGLTPCYG